METRIMYMVRDGYAAWIDWDPGDCFYRLHWTDGVVDSYEECFNELHHALSRLASLDELGTDGFRRHFKYEAGPFCEAADRFFEEVNGWT
jgi:hypothetical protein